MNGIDSLSNITGHSEVVEGHHTTMPSMMEGHHEMMPHVAEEHHETIPDVAEGQHEMMPSVAEGHHKKMSGVVEAHRVTMSGVVKGHCEMMPSVVEGHHTIMPSVEDMHHVTMAGVREDLVDQCGSCQILQENSHSKLNCVEDIIDRKEIFACVKNETSSTTDTIELLSKNTESSQLPFAMLTEGYIAHTNFLRDSNDMDDIVFDFTGDDDCNIPDVSVTECSSASLETYSDVYSDEQHCPGVMRNLREQQLAGEMCDLTLKVRDSVYKAHRCVLSANGAHMYSLVRERDVIDLTDAIPEPDLLQCLLEYMYTGQIHISMASVHDLLAASHRLGIHDIARCCSRHIEKHISVATWAHILKISFTFDLDDVAKKVADFVAGNIKLLYKAKAALCFTYSQLEFILQRCISLDGIQPEIYKLDLAIHWVIHDYACRCELLAGLLDYINKEMLTREDLEKVFRQSAIRDHQVFNSTTVQQFIEDVRLNLRTALRNLTIIRKPRKASKPVKLSKRGRPIKPAGYIHSADFGVDLDDTPDIDSDSDCYDKFSPKTRPNKSSRDSVKLTVKRRRGRPCKRSKDFVRGKQGQGDGLVKTLLSDPGDQNVRLASADNRKETFKHLYKIKTSKRAAGVDVKGAMAVDVKRAAVDGHECLTCGKKFGLRKQLTRHWLIHQEKNKSCDLCQYRATRSDKLRDHIRRVHGEEAVKRGLITSEKYQQKLEVDRSVPRSPRKQRDRKMTDLLPDGEMVPCLKCGRTFPSISSLKHHMKGHGSDIPFLCEVCGFSTIHFASINVHKRQHNGKKFRCPFPGCNYANIRKSRLDDHYNAHTGIKNHVCSVCGKAFAGRKHMQRHEKTHCDLKPLRCELCDYSTSRRDKLRDHTRKHHRLYAIQIGMLDPNSTPLPIKTTKASRHKAKSKKKPDSKSTHDDNIKADLSPAVPQHDTDLSSNYMTMTVPPHLISATSISDEMFQYLTSMTPGTSQQPQTPITLPTSLLPQQQTQIFSGIPISQASVGAVSLHSNPSLSRPPQSDTWIYQIVTDPPQY